MDIPGWVRLTSILEGGGAVWLQTRHISAVGVSATTIVRIHSHEKALHVSETVDEVMRLIDAANPPAA